MSELDLRENTTKLQEIVEHLDDMSIKDLVEGGASSCMLKDLADILWELAECIDHYRDKDAYDGRKLRRIK